MDGSIILNALGLFVQLVAPVLLAALLAGLVAGILRSATQIDDSIIGYSAKLASVGMALYLLSGRYSTQMLEFTKRVWGGSDFYF